MTDTYTKVGADIYASTDVDGNPRGPVMEEAATWCTETEQAVAGLSNFISNAPAVAANRTQLKALDTSVYKYAFVAEGDRAGYWRYDGGDVSSTVSPRSLLSSAVSGDQITITGHRLRDGDSFILATDTNGLTGNTYYYAKRVDANTIKAASSRINAIDGTTLSLTGTSAMTLKITPDDLEGTVVFKAGAALDGSAGAWLRVQRRRGEWDASHFGCIVGNSADNAPAIRCALHTAEEAGGGKVLIPAGSIYMVRGLRARRQVWLEGCGKQATILSFRGNSAAYAVDAYDDATDGAYPYDRTICGFRDFTIDASSIDAASNLIGFRLGGNYRSAPLLERVKVMQTPHYGILLDEDNWNIDIVDVELDTCGRLRSNSAGIYKNPAVTDINHINLTRVRVEGCGNASSAAGGWFLSTTTLATNRGWNIRDCQAEGNFGSDEVYISNLRGVYFDGFYIEAVYTTNAMEINNTVGHIHGAQITGANTAQHNALLFTGSSKFSVMDMQTYASFQNYDILAQDTAVIVTANNDGATTHTTDSATITGM